MSVANVRRLPYTPPVRCPGPVELVPPKRLVLKPIAWGKRDSATAKVLFQHLLEANPATSIPFHPMKDATLRRVLRSYRIHH